MTTKRAPKVTMKKYMGDDAYSWAVFLDGRVIEGLTGLNRDQAKHYVNQVKQSIAKEK